MTQRGFRAPLHYMGEPIGVAARRYLGYVFDALVRFGMDKDEASNVIANHLTTIMVAGEHDVVWDGTVSGGDVAASGAYELRVFADGAEGVTSVGAPVTLDRSSPKFTVPAQATASLGKAARVAFTVRDAWSPTVKVTVTVTDPGGAVVGTVVCGWVTQGKPATCAWKAASPGVYTLTFAGVDRAGNAQSVPPATQLTVR